MSSLVPTRAISAPPPETQPPQPNESTLMVAVDDIDPNPLQPRRVFDAERLKELAQSIEANGIIQPLILRKSGDRYQLVAGERRWRAAKQAGLKAVPAVIRDIPDERLLEVTLIENIQREDLNPIETATALQRMSEELALNADEVGRRTGKDRTTITNFTRLLQLPPEIQKLIAERQLSAGHGRCILTISSPDLQRQLAHKALANKWSVRETERFTQKLLAGKTAKRVEDVEQDPNVRAAIAEMQRVLGTRVRIIEGSRKRGKIEIEYYSQEDLDRIYSLVVGDNN